MINLNYFSQSIPELGFRVSLDMIYNALPKRLYFAIVSLNPPGKLYDVNDMKYEKATVFKDIDFKSKIGYYAFKPQIE